MKKVTYLALLALTISACLHAEIIFHTTQRGDSLKAQDYQQLYSLLLINQFPINMTFAKHMPAIIHNEVASIQMNIDLIFPNSGIKASFLPTTLYQLFCFRFISEHFDTISKESHGVLTRHKSTSLYQRIFDKASRKGLTSSIKIDYPQDFKRQMLDSGVIAFHRAINNYIVEQLQDNGLTIPQTKADCLNVLHVFDFAQSFNILQNKTGPYACPSPCYDPAYFEQAINIEWDANQINAFVLYRGLDSHDFKRFGKDPLDQQCPRADYSYSFGTSLLGGALFDLGACAYFYVRTRAQKIAVIIDKKEYAKGALGAMFFIAPISSLLDLLGQGSLFHSRSRVPDLNDVNYKSMSAGYHDGKKLAYYYEIPAKSKEDACPIYQDMLTYIAQNKIAIH